MSVKEIRKLIMKIVTAALMAALVYAGNFMSIPLSDDTRIHLGNSMCLLAGLLFGGVTGGVSSGLGGAMYDLFNPKHIASAPFTFINKFAMGFVAGVIRRKCGSTRTAVTAAAIFGQLTYILLYLLKSFIENLLLGQPVTAAAAALSVKAAASLINGGAACVIAVPLYFALSKALCHTLLKNFN